MALIGYAMVSTNGQSVEPQYAAQRSVELPVATADTGKLIHAAMEALDRLWRLGYRYKKPSAMPLNLVPAEAVAGGHFNVPDDAPSQARMLAFDALIARFGWGRSVSGRRANGSAGRRAGSSSASAIGRPERSFCVSDPYQPTSDGRCFVVRSRLWRCTNRTLPEVDQARLTGELMRARWEAVGAARKTDDREALASAGAAVDAAKTALGERGPVWWNDDAPDLDRRMAHTTPYADWYRAFKAVET